MSKLASTQDTVKVERMVFDAASEILSEHAGFLSPFFEHGHWWVGCSVCGGQWDAVDTNRGFDFEEVTAPDEDAEHEAA